jgi:hypothetical protein
VVAKADGKFLTRGGVGLAREGAILVLCTPMGCLGVKLYTIDEPQGTSSCGETYYVHLIDRRDWRRSASVAPKCLEVVMQLRLGELSAGYQY